MEAVEVGREKEEDVDEESETGIGHPSQAPREPPEARLTAGGGVAGDFGAASFSSAAVNPTSRSSSRPSSRPSTTDGCRV
jgi:hypothetical protein